MITKQKLEILKNYNSGLKLYKERKFQEALNFFEKALAIDPGDGPSQLYIQRCKEYIAKPPGEDWDGVFIMTTK